MSKKYTQSTYILDTNRSTLKVYFLQEVYFKYTSVSV